MTTKRKLPGSLGELIALWYSKEDNHKVQEAFPFLPEYHVIRDGDKAYIRVQALYDRILALQQDFKTNRLLRRHSTVPIV